MSQKRSLEAKESREVVCVVVAVGYEACRLVKAIPRTGYWRLVAVGYGCEDVDADRAFANDTVDDAHEWSARTLRELDEEWRNAGFVCVVYDERDLESCTFGGMVLARSRAAERLAMAVLLNDPCACTVERTADLVLRPSPRSPTSESSRADVLRIALGPFEGCWVPHDLAAVADAMRALGEGQVFAIRTDGQPSSAHRLAELLGEPTLTVPHFLHITVAAHTPLDLGEVALALDRRGAVETAFTASIDETFAHGEALVGVVARPAEPLRGGVAARLRSLIEQRAATRLPRDASARAYAHRLAREVAWWTTDEQLCTDTFALVNAADSVRAAGGIVGPGLHRRGGSLVAYVLGLSVFDPIARDLSFDDFRGRHDPIVLELSASARSCARHALPVYPELGSERRWAFRPETLLDDLEDVVARPFTWRLTDARDLDAFASLWRRPLPLAHASGDVQFIHDYRDALRRMAPRTLDDLCAAVAILRPMPVEVGLVDGWVGDAAPTDADVVPGVSVITKNTRGWLIYEEQVTRAFASVLSTTTCRAYGFRRQVAKHGSLAGPAGGPPPASCLDVAIPADARADVAAVLQQRSMSAYSRSHALSEALIWLSLARARVPCRSGASHDCHDGDRE